MATLSLAAVLAALGAAPGSSLAVSTKTRAVASNTIGTAASFDTVAPTVSATVIAKTGQYFAGSIHQGGSYQIYAQASDGGIVPSGIASIRANVGAITTGQTSVALTLGSYTVEGVTYNYRSAAVTANASLAAGSSSYSLTSTDNNGNAGTQSGSTVTVDNTVPTASDIQCVNGGATVGRLDPGDVCTFTFSEIIDPESILSGWTGISTNVVVRFADSGSNDALTVWNAANSVQLNLGSVNTKGDYVGSAVTAGASGTASTMVLNTGTNTVTITLGTLAGTLKTDTANHTAAWTPSASAFDRAGNAETTTVRNETGAGDKDF